MKLIAFVLFCTPFSATAQTWTNDFFTSDAGWNTFWFGNGTFVESFNGEGRIANNALTGDWEYGINRNNPPFTFGVATGQFVWPNATGVPFTLTYSGSVTREITWTLGSAATLSTTASINYPWIRLLDIRVRAAANTVVRLDNLSLNGVAAPAGTRGLADGVATNPSAAVNYLRLEADNLSNGFTITGDATFDWTALGSPPSGSAMSFQFKAMQAVPEPASLALIGAAGFGLIWWRRHRARQSELKAAYQDTFGG